MGQCLLNKLRTPDVSFGGPSQEQETEHRNRSKQTKKTNNMERGILFGMICMACMLSADAYTIAGNTEGETTPEGTTPEGTTPEGTTPEGTTTEGATTEAPRCSSPEVETMDYVGQFLVTGHTRFKYRAADLGTLVECGEACLDDDLCDAVVYGVAGGKCTFYNDPDEDSVATKLPPGGSPERQFIAKICTLPPTTPETEGTDATDEPTDATDEPLCEAGERVRMIEHFGKKYDGMYEIDAIVVTSKKQCINYCLSEDDCDGIIYSMPMKKCFIYQRNVDRQPFGELPLQPRRGQTRLVFRKECGDDVTTDPTTVMTTEEAEETTEEAEETTEEAKETTTEWPYQTGTTDEPIGSDWLDWIKAFFDLSDLGKGWSAKTAVMGDDGLVHAELVQNPEPY